MKKIMQKMMYVLVLYIFTILFIKYNYLTEANASVQYMTESSCTTMIKSSTEVTTYGPPRMTTTTRETTTETTTQTTTIIETTTETTTVKTTFTPSRYNSLGNRGDISEADMKKVLAYYYKKNKTPFYGQEAIFIKAANSSGLDPVYILAHAAVESGWGKHHLGKHNYFGIGAYDYNPVNCGYTMGNNMESGIVSGACWISDHYYKNGQNTLYGMIYGRRRYASAGDRWIGNIESIMKTSYSIIKS